MELSERTFGDVVVLAPAGRIDLSNGDEFSNRLTAVLSRHTATPPEVVLDLSGLEYIASIGLRALMVAAKQVKASEGKIAVASLQPTVSEIFDISRFKFVVPVFGTVREAIDSMSEAAGEVFAKETGQH